MHDTSLVPPQPPCALPALQLGCAASSQATVHSTYLPLPLPFLFCRQSMLHFEVWSYQPSGGYCQSINRLCAGLTNPTKYLLAAQLIV